MVVKKELLHLTMYYDYLAKTFSWPTLYTGFHEIGLLWVHFKFTPLFPCIWCPHAYKKRSNQICYRITSSTKSHVKNIMENKRYLQTKTNKILQPHCWVSKQKTVYIDRDMSLNLYISFRVIFMYCLPCSQQAPRRSKILVNLHL